MKSYRKKMSGFIPFITLVFFSCNNKTVLNSESIDNNNVTTNLLFEIIHNQYKNGLIDSTTYYEIIDFETTTQLILNDIKTNPNEVNNKMLDSLNFHFSYFSKKQIKFFCEESYQTPTFSTNSQAALFYLSLKSLMYSEIVSYANLSSYSFKYIKPLLIFRNQTVNLGDSIEGELFIAGANDTKTTLIIENDTLIGFGTEILKYKDITKDRGNFKKNFSVIITYQDGSKKSFNDSISYTVK